MPNNTAAARKARQRIRQINAGLTRVELLVPEERKAEIKDIANKMLQEKEQEK